MAIPLMLALALMAPALAQQADEPQNQAAEPEEQRVFSLEADLRSEYLQGQPIIVMLTARNNANGTRSFPDIGQRQHLVRFVLEQANGSTKTHRVSTPKQDQDLRWQVSGGKTRSVMLEIPSSGTFPVGTHKLTVEVQDDRGGVWTVGPKTVHLVPPTPVAGSATFDAAMASKVGGQAVFAHKGKELNQLYLLHTDADNPARKVGIYWLADADHTIDPVLTRANPAKAWSRHIYWRKDGSLRVVQLSGPGKAFAPVRVDIPYPNWELLDVGATDLLGGLHVPVWIPKRKGGGGEIRVVTIRRGRPVTTRKVVELEGDADFVTTGVDGAGKLRIALANDGNVDVYNFDTDPDAELPAAGKRFRRKDQGGEVLGLAFGNLPDTGDDGGGRGLMVLERTSTETGQSLLGRWFSLGGTEVTTTRTLEVPSVREVTDVLPFGSEGFTMLYRDGEGASFVASTGAEPVAIKTGLDPELLSAGDATWLRWWSPTDLAKLAQAPQPVTEAE